MPIPMIALNASFSAVVFISIVGLLAYAVASSSRERHEIAGVQSRALAARRSSRRRQHADLGRGSSAPNSVLP